MRLEAPGVRIADVETCDFGLMANYDTATLLRLARPDGWRRQLESAASRRLIAELGVERRHLTHVPGRAPDRARRTAIDLARSAVERLRARRPRELARLDALLFVSTSNPNPVNSQAAWLADELGLSASCFDLKAGCSSGVLGLSQAALLIAAGCERVLVVVGENLSHLMPADDLRALLTVGDGAACLLVEKCSGPGFRAILHGTAPDFARAIAIPTPFPPPDADAEYVYQFSDVQRTREFLRDRWRATIQESLAAAGIPAAGVAQFCLHQTHAGQVDTLVAGLGIDPARVPRVVHDHGNMGSPTFAVAMAQVFPRIAPGQTYLIAAVGGGVSWCAIVAEHR